MPVAVQHIKRYGEIARLILKYGRGRLRSDFAAQAALDEADSETAEEFTQGQPESLADDLEKMGPVFIKLGQLLSTRADIVPPIYLDALGRLQDKVEPIPAETAIDLIEEELRGRISKLFSEFDEKVLAAASLGQVHKARLRDGRPVAVKVQRPGVRKKISEDLEVLREIVDFLDSHNETARRYEFKSILEELEQSLTRETDYNQEAQNLQILHENLAEFPHIVVPLAIRDYTTSRVLTMEFVPGKKLTAVSAVEWTEVSRMALADELFAAYLKQLVVDGFFHADPHPGNVYLTDDHRIALLDLGMVARISEPLQISLIKLLLAISEGRGSEAATVAEKMAEFPKQDFDRHAFHRLISDLVLEHQTAHLGNLEMGRVIMNIRRVAADSGVKINPALNMLGKALLNLDKVGATLAPEFDPNQAVRTHAGELLRRRFKKGFSLGSVYNSVLEMNELVQQLPSKLNKIIDTVSDNELRIRIDSIDETKLISGLQKIANRIALGLVLAALIIAAAMLVRIPTAHTLWGYPAIAMLFFLAAAGGGIALIVSTLLHDVKDKRH
jgi:predicted unusual protein kinase regulating ubiquinone biosynthesis (AarF/ABC1/UbiB family)